MVRGKDNLGLFLVTSPDGFCQERLDVKFSMTVMCAADPVSAVTGGETLLVVCCSPWIFDLRMHALAHRM